MLFHFTQICAFLTYLFRFCGLLFRFYRHKNTDFSKSANVWVEFSWKMKVFGNCKIAYLCALIVSTSDLPNQF
jgi:hypothetical protein